MHKTKNTHSLFIARKLVDCRLDLKCYQHFNEFWVDVHDFDTAARYYANIEKADRVMSECWPDIFVTMLGVSPTCCNRFQRSSMRFIRITVATREHTRAQSKRAIVEQYV